MALAAQDWQQGFDAHMEGKDVKANPYQKGSLSSDTWLQGWRDAEQDARLAGQR